MEALEGGLVRVRDVGLGEALVFNLWDAEFWRMAIWVRGNGIVEDVELTPRAMSDLELRHWMRGRLGVWREDQAEEDAEMVRRRESNPVRSRAH